MKIIINADDFGATKSINDAIINVHSNGILTSATIMAGGNNFDGAVKYIRNNPSLGIGVHLAIDGSHNVLKCDSSLINPLTGVFYNSNDVLKRIYLNKYKHVDLVSEYSAQIEKVLNAGVRITHLDHHHHLHLHYPILKAVLEVAEKYNIKKIRSQRIILLPNKNFIKKLYREIYTIKIKRHVITTDGYFTFATNNIDKLYSRVVKLLELKIKSVEIVVHPREKNDFESFILTSDFFSNFKQIRFISYNDL